MKTGIERITEEKGETRETHPIYDIQDDTTQWISI